jgi:VanZ family protein
MRQSSTTRVFRLLACLYALAIVAASSWPRLRLPEVEITGIDKVAHFGQYLVFSFLVAGGWRRSAGSLRRPVAWLPILVLIAFAALDEYHQWIPGRDPDMLDWGADLIGIVIGYWAGGRWVAGRNRSARSESDRGGAK